MGGQGEAPFLGIPAKASWPRWFFALVAGGFTWIGTYCTRQGHFRHLFTISTLIYWYFYDEMKHSYISRIYQIDKYGVVLNYAVLTLLAFLLIITDVLADLSARLDRGEKKAELRPLVLYLARRGAIQLLKILLFNFIFKNNTSDSRAHQTIHVVCVCCLGFVALVDLSYLPTRRVLSLSFERRLLSLLLLGCLFQLSGWCSEGYCWESYWPLNYVCDYAFVSPPWWNFWTMFFEALLIEKTLPTSIPPPDGADAVMDLDSFEKELPALFRSKVD